MEEITIVVGQNIKRIRDDKGLSLDKLSQLTDVSKSMLGQIERGESSPSINILWKIAQGLKINLNSLILEEKQEYYKVNIRKALEQDGGNYLRFPIFDFTQERNFETFRVELESQGVSEGVPHVKGSIEFITVFSGTLTLYLENEIIDISRGESVWFNADIEHKYSNESLLKTEYSLMLYYPKGKK